MEKLITDERTGLQYELVGDYYLIAGEDEPEGRLIGIWGQRHLRYLKQHRKVLYSELLKSGKLNDYLADINEQAEDMFSRLVDISDTIKANRKKRIAFEPEEARLIRHCLMEWRNREIQAERQGAVDGINELLILFTR